MCLRDVAYHESGHAVATVHLFDAVHPVKYVEIIEHAPGQWSGHCVNRGIASVQWPSRRAMLEAQIMIHLAGGVAEGSFAFATTDRERARAVGDELFRLTGVVYDEQWHIDRTRALLSEHHAAVELVARGLVENRRVEGDQLERWISYAS